ncbi:MAG TPA: hypothetical protein VGR26_07385 [Acidimicrobiales bacterium]|nr:hypothetical protein [Acidimicrobiales bacterium]
MSRCRRRGEPVETYGTHVVVGQMHHRLPGHLGPSFLWTPIEFRDVLVAAKEVLLEEDEPTSFWVRPSPAASVHQRSPIVWLLLMKLPPLFRGRSVCGAHQLPPVLLVNVERGVCSDPGWFMACEHPGCFDTVIDQTVHVVLQRLGSAYRSPHLPRRQRWRRIT